MSDYLGPNQTRVLDSDYRSFEGVVYQKRKPPLSSEATFSNKVASENSRLDLATVMPSGWLVTGDIRDNDSELAFYTGDVMCSPTLSSNMFKLITTDRGTGREKLIAVVNGWRLLVQGSVTSGAMDSWENNNIILPLSPAVGSRVDFVFLEAWRKLISPSDTIYKYGNVNYGGTNYSNDLIDPAVNFETSLRVQIQYRIRVVASIRSEYYPEGFDPLAVYAQGAQGVPQNCSLANFNRMSTDAGLWRAGLGDDASIETLGTVDGYSYAIPMFLIRRRNTTAYNPDSNANGAGYARADYITGWSSDRPDGLYSDIIVADDILDIRHTVGASEASQELCDEAFRKVISGKARTKMAKSVWGGESYGSVLVKADSISAADYAGSQGIGVDGDGTRRMYVNAQVDQPATFAPKTVWEKQSGTPGSNWTIGDTVRVSVSVPTGSTIQSIDKAFSGDDPSINLANSFNYGSLPSSYVDLEIKTDSSLAGSSSAVTVEYTARYAQGPHGFNDLPDMFFESGPVARSLSGGNSFALPNTDIPVRSVQGTIYDPDTTAHHTLSNRAWTDSSQWNFGHQLIYYPTTTGPTFTVPRDLFGYDIQGVAAVTVNGADATVSTISRTSTQYTVTLGTSGNIGVNLYTGGKFFEVSEQGRGITNTYEMVTMTPENAVDGINGTGSAPFVLDSTHNLLLAFASLSQDLGYGYCYVNGALKRIGDGYHAWNTLMPDSTRTRTTVWFDIAPSGGSTVEIPVLQYSAVQASDGYQVFYKTIPYQGTLDSTTVTGNVRIAGRAIVTTAGSGSTALQATTYKNIIDRMPAMTGGNDCSGDYTPISMSNTGADPTIETYVVSAVQDIMDRPEGTALIGRTDAVRGRAGVVLPGAPLSGSDGYPYVGLKMGKLDTTGQYQKTYQSYLIDKDSSGELYLMVMGSESDNASAERYFTYSAGYDSVDLFRMPGRPLASRR